MIVQKPFRSAALAFCIFIVAGCAGNQADTTDSATTRDTTNPTTLSGNSTAGSAAAAANEARIAHARQAAAAAAAAEAAAAIPNPTTVSFEKMSTVLDDGSRQTVVQLTDRAKMSKKVTITGFCDSRQIANPIDAAVARAIAVRDELLVRGVAPGAMAVKYSTRTPKKHAVEVRFD